MSFATVIETLERIHSDIQSAKMDEDVEMKNISDFAYEFLSECTKKMSDLSQEFRLPASPHEDSEDMREAMRTALAVINDKTKETTPHLQYGYSFLPTNIGTCRCEPPKDGCTHQPGVKLELQRLTYLVSTYTLCTLRTDTRVQFWKSFTSSDGIRIEGPRERWTGCSFDDEAEAKRVYEKLLLGADDEVYPGTHLKRYMDLKLEKMWAPITM